MNENQEVTDMMQDLAKPCGCGKPVRYVVSKDGTMACNKYGRCMTYEQLASELQKCRTLLIAYRKKRKHDGLNGRAWDASKHFEAEALIEKFDSGA